MQISAGSDDCPLCKVSVCLLCCVYGFILAASAHVFTAACLLQGIKITRRLKYQAFLGSVSVIGIHPMARSKGEGETVFAVLPLKL